MVCRGEGAGKGPDLGRLVRRHRMTVAVGCAVLLGAAGAPTSSFADPMLPTSSVSIPACSRTGQLAATVTSDPTDPTVAPLAIHYIIDDGPEQAVLTTGNPGIATVSVPSGSHSLEFWGEDTAGDLEDPHQTADVLVDS